MPDVDLPDDLNTVDHFSYVVGYEDGTVMPQKQITRAEVATIFYRLLKDDVREEYDTTTNNFSDVTSGQLVQPDCFDPGKHGHSQGL